MRDYPMKKSDSFAIAVVCGAVVFFVTDATAMDQSNEHVASRVIKHRSAPKALHRLVLQVSSNEPAMMNLALNNATNVAQYYKDLGQKVSIEIVTYGPGLH